MPIDIIRSSETEPETPSTSSDQPTDENVMEIDLKSEEILAASISKTKDGINSDEVQSVCQRFGGMSTQNTPSEEMAPITNQETEGLIENKIQTIKIEMIENPTQMSISDCLGSDDNSDNSSDSDEQSSNEQNQTLICRTLSKSFSSPKDKQRNFSSATTDPRSCSEEYSASESGNCRSSFATSVSDTDESWIDDTEGESSECENSNYEASEESVSVNRTEDCNHLSSTTSSSSEFQEDVSLDDDTHETSSEVSSSTIDTSCSSVSVCDCNDCCNENDDNSVRCQGCGRSLSTSASEVSNANSFHSISSSLENVRHISLSSTSGFDRISDWPGAGSETATSAIESSTEDSAIIVCNCCDCFGDCLATDCSDGQSESSSVSLVDVGTSTDDVNQQRNPLSVENSINPVNYPVSINVFVIIRII